MTQNVLWSRASVCVCLCVCLSVRSHMPRPLHGPGCNLGSGRGCPLVALLFGRFAISARVALLWQHYRCMAELSGNLPGPPHAMPRTTRAREDSLRQR